MYQLVEIKWLDAETSHGWEEDVDASNVPVTTVGFLVYKDERNVVIASTVSDKQHNSRIKIPKGMIRKMRPIKVTYE